MDKHLAGLNVIDFAILPASSTAAVGLASGTPALVNGTVSGKTVRRVFITAATASGLWRADGTAPAAGSAHTLASGDSLSFTGANYKQLIGAIQFLATASTCNLSITYFD